MAGRDQQKGHAMTNETKTYQTETQNAPDWVVKAPKGYGRNSKLERIGVAWNRDKDEGICIRIAGTQIIADDIYLVPSADVVNQATDT